MHPFKNLLLVVCLLTPYIAQSQSIGSQNKPQVALLGTFHFGETPDLSAITMENTLGERRQSEIEELVTQLAAFRPTKIMIELEPSNAHKINQQYQNYLEGSDSLRLNEIHQIGFRLADKLGHPKLYCIDHHLNLPFDKIVQYLQEHNKMDEFQSFLDNVHQYTSRETAILKDMNLSQYYKRMNSDEVDAFTNKMYLKDMITAFGEEAVELTARASAVWLERNIIIMKNILGELKENDRVLVIIGAAHRAIIKDYLRNVDEVEYIEISSFLE